ncbi:SAM-dependent DNA methyltransferase [Serratia marcescens]|uniref:SAM-dependent DNA methyltransferase n=1 Tax=Serratia marcescens TaxID=615 RepID=UPI001150456E|nr:SAM-dependent DNA methyltransferase [Serratia marcescens]QDI55081.1 SAM-dependent DNA methyltransferase [Serratia marcescens]
MSQLSFDDLFSVPVDALRPAEKNVRADAVEQSSPVVHVPGRKRTITGDDPRKAFLSTFRETARNHHRYEVFSDFVKLAACALENACLKSPDIEAEYMATIQRYEKADAQRMAQLLSLLVIGLDQGMGIFSVRCLWSSSWAATVLASFHAVPSLELMAGLVAGDRLAALENEPYITLSEPTCGAGGMVIAFAKVMLARGYNPQTQLRADCVDIDPVAARMCYIQLSLLGIPARVVIGNSLTLKYQREMYTPFWYRVTSTRWPMYR